MERWGDPELHSYNIGVYDCLNKAKVAGQEGKEHRGGKYEAKIDMYTLNDEDGVPDTSYRFKLGRISTVIYYARRKKERRFDILLYKTRSGRSLSFGLYFLNVSFTWSFV